MVGDVPAAEALTNDVLVEVWKSAGKFRGESRVPTGSSGWPTTNYLVLGRTVEGRHLLVVLTYLGGGEARPITAREMDERERALFRRK